MKHFPIEKLAQLINARVSKPARGVITGVAIDSRIVKAGDCFVAVKGQNFDGHDFIAEAFARSAACVVAGKDVAGDGVILQVPDTRKALGRFAGEYRREQSFKVVAVTGSVGKTTTRQMIFHVLKRRFRCRQSPKNYNTDIGLPLTLLGAEPDCEIVIAELGSNYPGEMAYLSRVAQPDLALITNVSIAHLAGFGNLQSIIEEKVCIAEGLKPGADLIINGGIVELVEHCKSKSLNFLTFGKRIGCDISAQNISSDGIAGRFMIDDTQICVPLPGLGNVENAVAAWAVVSRFGFCSADFAKALPSLPAVPMRMELVKVAGLTVLNDCYNANPASMKNALDALVRIGSSRQGRLVFICGPMLELGPQSEELHTQLGQAIADAGVKLLLAIGQFAAVTAEAAKHPGMQLACFADTDSVCNNLEKFLKPDDIILVKGSRACGLEAVIEKIKELFA